MLSDLSLRGKQRALQRRKQCSICIEASSLSWPLFLLSPPISLSCTGSSKVTWSCGSWNSTLIPKERPLLEGGQGPLPHPLWDAVTRRCGSGACCYLLNTNCIEQFPGTLVESRFPPNPQDISQILEGLLLSLLLLFTKPTSFRKRKVLLKEQDRVAISMPLPECTSRFCSLQENDITCWNLVL